MKIEDRWRFHTADFSMQASGTSEYGSVTLIRCKEDHDLWHRIVDNIENEDKWPELYAMGTGKTLEEAILNANLRAAHLPSLSPKEN